MAIGACYGGPMLNLLLGVGGTSLYLALRERKPFELSLDTGVALGVGTLTLSLLSAVIYIPLNKWSAGKKFGLYLLVLYTVFLVVEIVFEVTNFKPLG